MSPQAQRSPSPRRLTSALAAAAVGAASMVLVACSSVGAKSANTQASQSISTADVRAAQKAWGDGIVAIGKTFTDGGDYAARASQHITQLYAYGTGEVLFKPTLAAQDQYRETFSEALSYFVGGEVAEDKGFAIKPWSAVRFGQQQIITDSDSAVAMGNYHFTPVGSTEEVTVEFTFGYVRDANGDLRINVHHSSLPHSG